MEFDFVISSNIKVRVQAIDIDEARTKLVDDKSTYSEEFLDCVVISYGNPVKDANVGVSEQ